MSSTLPKNLFHGALHPRFCCYPQRTNRDVRYHAPPELRGHSYAGSVTAATIERIYAEGRKIACLYADLRNPASNRCYTKIGFTPVCTSLHFRREVV